ncbi:hypothetical protein [Candidatus Phytoplasma solani]|uniref:hypothetical protein n=1 Tax=Candidatus Phytoplasma solani TaxID=69896 RepID=UPI0003B7BE43|nr:hypothetical protein [Candidatus Phytoplasma solani]CCP88300.1 conserved hypothetical protein [Candidatus Phytoplasma solani]
MLNSQQNILKRIIATSFLLFLAFFLELICRFTINSGVDCSYSFFKIELIFIILIGFLFGFKYSFFATLSYLLIHFAFEYFQLEAFFGSNHDDHNHQKEEIFLIFLYRFFLPYLACCLSGLFYQKKENQLFSKKSLIFALLIISVVQVVASMLFIDLLKNHFFEEKNSNILINFLFPEKRYDFLNINVIYSLVSVVINNLLIGVLLYLINFRLKGKLEFLQKF